MSSSGRDERGVPLGKGLGNKKVRKATSIFEVWGKNLEPLNESDCQKKRGALINSVVDCMWAQKRRPGKGLVDAAP